MPDHRQAAHQHARLVAAGRNARLWSNALNKQIYLGSDEFVHLMQQMAQVPTARSKQAPKAQRSVPRTVKYWFKESATREDALRLRSQRYHHDGLGC